MDKTTYESNTNPKMRNSSNIFLFIYLIVISVLEISAYLFHGIFSILASRIWILGGIICFIIIIYHFFQIIIKDISEGKYLAFFSLYLIFAILLILLENLNFTEVNPDAVQQVTAGLNSFTTPDFNYTGISFLYYPHRQYILSALPSVLFGRSIFSIQLGFAYPFLLGIMSLYCGIRKWAEKMRVYPLLSILPIYALFVFPFVTEYYLNFEQTIYPIAFTMIITGFYLLFMIKPNLPNLFIISWVGCLLGSSYTPALATLLLLTFLITSTCYNLYKQNFFTFKPEDPKTIAKLLGLTSISTIIFYLMTLTVPKPNMTPMTVVNTDIITTIFTGIYSFCTDTYANFWGMAGLIILIYLLCGISFSLTKRDFVISFWALGVFIATYVYKGYTTYKPELIMHRSLVVIPIILTGMILYLFDFIKKYNIKTSKQFIIIFISICLTASSSSLLIPNRSFTYFNYVQPVKYLIYDLDKTLKQLTVKPEGDFNVIFYTQEASMKNFNDYSKYFFPNAKVYLPDKDEIPTYININKPSFIYGSSTLSNMDFIKTEEKLFFENIKHNAKITLYKSVLK